MDDSSLAVRREGPVARVVLTRPDLHNAFNGRLIEALHSLFGALGEDPEVRVIVLSGEGKTFCAGADINWMRASFDLLHSENVEEARALWRMLQTIDRVPKPVIAQVQGAALGGGMGLIAVCDIVIAAGDAIFGFTETKLGLLPAVISPFVLAKIGISHLRALALTGERFGAARAHAIGLVHDLVASEADLEGAVARVIGELLSASSTGIAAAKTLFARVAETDYDATLEITAAAIARQRTSREGQDGLLAFLEKRPPPWTQ